jgi:hypothetical protein
MKLAKILTVVGILGFSLETGVFLSFGQSTPETPDSAGTTNSGPTGNYPGTGSSITNVPTAPPGTTPGSASAGTTNSGPTGNYPGTGSSITNVPTAPPGTTPGSASAGTTNSSPTGNYPGTGSSITNAP